jgi:hypothetical protein
MRKLPRWVQACVVASMFAATQAAEGLPQSTESGPETCGTGVGEHAFDWEFGEWTVELSRLQQPLTGSTGWAHYEGRSVVRRVWGGRANLGELEVEGPEGRIVGLSLRLFDPVARQWRIHWASSRTGELGQAMVGQFGEGRGEFYNHETFGGRPVLVRFVFSDITHDTFRFEQAFSTDGGATWEANWIARFRRVAGDAAGGCSVPSGSSARREGR